MFSATGWKGLSRGAEGASPPPPPPHPHPLPWVSISSSCCLVKQCKMAGDAQHPHKQSGSPAGTSPTPLPLSEPLQLKLTPAQIPGRKEDQGCSPGEVQSLPGSLWDITAACVHAVINGLRFLGPFLRFLSYVLGAEPWALTQVSAVCSHPPTWKLVIPAANWLRFCTSSFPRLIPFFFLPSQ